jgi:hypothetical protein
MRISKLKILKSGFQAFALLILCSFIANGKNHFVFNVEDCSWHASHIIVVTEGDKIDGQVMVLESWRGQIQPGESLFVPELAKFKSQASRKIECISGNYPIECPDGTPKFVSGSKIVVFLRSKPNLKEWIAIGAVWIEQGEAYGLWDDSPPWENGMLASIGSEVSVERTVTKVSGEIRELKQAFELEDANARLQILKPFQQPFANPANPGQGYKATIASVEIDALRRVAINLDTALQPNSIPLPTVKCDDDCVGAIFALQLQRELEFWKATAPELQTGWRFTSDMNTARQLSNTEAILRALDRLNYGEGVGLVKELRAFWSSLPQLRYVAHIIDRCDAFLIGR